MLCVTGLSTPQARTTRTPQTIHSVVDVSRPTHKSRGLFLNPRTTRYCGLRMDRQAVLQTTFPGKTLRARSSPDPITDAPGVSLRWGTPARRAWRARGHHRDRHCVNDRCSNVPSILDHTSSATTTADITNTHCTTKRNNARFRRSRRRRRALRCNRIRSVCVRWSMTPARSHTRLCGA